MAAATAAENPMLMSDEAETQLKKMNFGLIKQCDMTEEMRQETMDAVIAGVEKFADNMEMAAKFTKDSMEKKYGPTWHVVCGEGFGFNVTYEQKHCLYMFFGGTGRLTACLVYKSCEA